MFYGQAFSLPDPLFTTGVTFELVENIAGMTNTYQFTSSTIIKIVL